MGRCYCYLNVKYLFHIVIANSICKLTMRKFFFFFFLTYFIQVESSDAAAVRRLTVDGTVIAENEYKPSICVI